MKISEIIHIPAQEPVQQKLPSIELWKLKNTNYLGAFKLFECWQADVCYLIVVDSKEPIAYLICTELTDVKVPSTNGTLMIKRTWCSPNHRRRGIIINLYRYLYNDVNYALIADVEQTPASQAIWKQLVNWWPCYCISTKTLDIEPARLTPETLDAVYDGTTDHTIIVYGSTRLVGTAFQVENFDSISDHLFLLTED